jgi:hypothetical protein
VRFIWDTADGPPGFTGWFHEAGRTGRFAGTLLPKWLPGWLSRSGIQRRHIRVGTNSRLGGRQLTPNENHDHIVSCDKQDVIGTTVINRLAS